MKRLKIFLATSAILGSYALANQVHADQNTDILVSKTNYNQVSKTFDVIGKEQGRKIARMDVAIWSEENGQDDLKWYTADNFSSGQSKVSFNLENHNNEAGNYNIHVYTTYVGGSRSGKILDNTVISVQSPQIEQDSSGFNIYNIIKASSDSELVTAVWSEENGQDDLKWYLTNSLETRIPLSNHKGTGQYHFHTYIRKNGNMTLLSKQSRDVVRKNTNYRWNRNSDTSIELIINDIPSNIISILVPVWSDVNGQDDIKWYTATKIGPSSYKVTIPLGSHGFDYGHFSAHIYGTNSKGTLEHIVDTDGFDVTEIKSLENPLVSLKPLQNGQFSVSVAEVAMSKKVVALTTTVTSLTDASKTITQTMKAVGYGKASHSFDLKTLSSFKATYTVSAKVDFSDNTSTTFTLPNQEYNPQILSETVSTQPASPKITTYINEQNTYPVGQCTWGVKALAPWVPNWLGNANGWATNMRSKGFRVGYTPEVGAVAVWPHDGGGYGHVAYVVAVESPARIQVKESNYAGKQYISNFRGWFNPQSSMWGGSVLYVYPN